MTQQDKVPAPPQSHTVQPRAELVRPSEAQRPGAVTRLLRSLRALPLAELSPGQGSAELAGWLRQEAPAPVDVSGRFRVLLERVRQGERVLPREAVRHQYLLVKGMFGEQIPGYMLDNRQRLEQRGLQALEVAVDTEARLEANVAVVRKALEDAAFFRRSVVVVAHSKGGVESLGTLAIHPELIPTVRAVVTIQSPYAGSVIANDLAGTPALRRLLDAAFPLFFEEVDASGLEDLSYARRREFVLRHPYPAHRVPTVALASSRLSRRSVLRPFCQYVWQRYGLASDGLVSAVDAEVPGAHVVRLDDMDHAESVLLGLPGFANYHPGDITEALVALALEL